jgi:acetolactate synthase-1/2/3 large subunit
MKTTAAKILAQKLHRAGCRHAFGMPGGEVLVIMQAMAEAGIEFTLCKHENAAGFMAEGSWQASGAPGILLTTIGPGLANGVNSVANAFQEQVPLFVISGCVEDAEAQSFTHQIIDQKALLTPITKAHFQVAEGNMDKIIDKAIAIAMADPPGPVHIDVPHNIAGSALEYGESEDGEPGLAATCAGHWPDGQSLDKARTLLGNAERAIMIAGLGALHHDAGAEILDLCETHSVPLVTTYKAKGIMDENHPLCLGGHGLSPRSDSIILPLLAQSDCIILAGYDPIEMRSGWIEPWAAKNAIDIIHADIQHGMHGARIRFVGNVATSLSRLGNDLSPSGKSWAGGEITKARAELDEMFSSREEWGPHRIFATTRAILPENGIATVDSGAHRILLSQMWKCSAPRTMLQSSAFCTMGISLPLGIGFAKTINASGTSHEAPNVVVFAGDAGLEMVMGELATLRDLNLAIVIIVMVDNSLALIDLKQSRSNLPNLGVDFGSTDLVAVAQAYGGNGQWIDDAASLETALETALDADRFTLLACRIDKRHYLGAF